MVIACQWIPVSKTTSQIKRKGEPQSQFGCAKVFLLGVAARCSRHGTNTCSKLNLSSFLYFVEKLFGDNVDDILVEANEKKMAVFRKTKYCKRPHSNERMQN